MNFRSARPRNWLFHTTPLNDITSIIDRYLSKTTSYVDIPIVIIVNRFTLSTAETFASVMKFHKKAWIVGDFTWGKATIQESTPFISDKLLLFETTKIMRMPDGSTSHTDFPLKPDFSVGQMVLSHREVSTEIAPPIARSFASSLVRQEVASIEKCATTVGLMSQQSMLGSPPMSVDLTEHGKQLEQARRVMACLFSLEIK